MTPETDINPAPEIKEGDFIHATQMPSDSTYLEAKGNVTSVRNGYVHFQATKVRDRFSKKWADHPTSCATACKIEHATIITE